VDWEPFIRVALAALFAIPLGLDRELRGKSAGLRTHVVVSVASAAFGYVSVLAADGAGNDETRIAAQVVSGIGFLGAGVIFAAGNRVHGLTTAAALWAASAIGLCAGLGATWLAFATMVVTSFVLGPLDWISDKLVGRIGLHERVFTVIVPDIAQLNAVHTKVRQIGGRISDISISTVDGSIAARMVLRCDHEQSKAVDDYLTRSPDVRFMSTGPVGSSD
jgi:putative Mg2+ transporter-C (MgtC) family protein